MSIDCAFTVTGEGPALFLVHGIGSRRAGWDSLLPVLTPHFSVITYDLRGHGESPLPTERFGLDALVDDLEALRERLGIEKAHIAGHSLGGMIGPAFALRYPERVLSLGLLSTAAFRTEDDSAKVKGVVAAMRERGIPNILETLTDRWFTDAFIAANADVVEARMQQVLSTPAEIFLNVFDIYAETEMAPWLHEVRAPSLVLTGENDGGCNPRLNRLIDEALPNSRLEILPDLKHSILLEAGPLVAERLAAFIRSL